MLKLILSRLKGFLLRSTRDKKFGRVSFSQEGEDVLLERIIGPDKINGFYVDIGAHHPIKFSNTYLFYKKGWRGINIDAMPGSMEMFETYRHGDINLEIPVSDVSEDLTYYMFNTPELNTFVADQTTQWDGKWGIKVIEKRKMRTMSVTEILNQYLDSRIPIDLLSIDVEGMDFRILKSIDLSKFQVKYIFIEQGLLHHDELMKSDVYKYLESKGYSIISKLYYTVLYGKVS